MDTAPVDATPDYARAPPTREPRAASALWTHHPPIGRSIVCPPNYLADAAVAAGAVDTPARRVGPGRAEGRCAPISCRLGCPLEPPPLIPLTTGA